MLRVEGLPVSAGGPALTFDVPDGRCVGLLGRDATLLLHLAETLAGLRVPRAGRVLVDERRHMSICLPRAVDPRTTLGEHVGTIAGARGLARKHVDEGIARLGLVRHLPLTTPAARAAAALLGALVAGTRVVVLHDPFADLDAAVRAKAIDWIRALAGSRTSIVITGADERDVRAVSHSVIDVEAGR